MEEPRTYATAGAFRSALEERLKSISQTEQMDLNRLRRQVSFDRFLARLFQVEPAPWAPKGGYALELRFKTARSTIDIGLTVRPVGGATGQAGVSRVVREMLQSAASVALGDWFEYRFGSPVMDLEAAPYGGAGSPSGGTNGRARVFSLPSGCRDRRCSDAANRGGRLIEWLAFAGIKSPLVQMIPREKQFAEKLHAYTLPRSSANSRVKDLVDLALLVESGGLVKERIKKPCA